MNLSVCVSLKDARHATVAREIKDGIFWIGVNNPKGRDFHGISTPRGGSYNSYLIKDEMPTIIDGTNRPFYNDYLESLRQAIDPGEVRFIVINHAEPDHAGALKELMNDFRNAKIVCTEKCKEFLLAAFRVEAEFVVVNDGDELKIGSRTLRFYTDPMVHWPETMMSYLEEDKILFSSDLFGTEISHEALFADEMDDFSTLTRDYFALVLRPFALPVKKAIKKVRALELEYIAPSHGPIYRDPWPIVDYSEKLASDPEEDKVLVLFFSIWESNQKMAHEIAKGIRESGMQAKVMDISKTNFVDIMAESLTSKALVVGSLTMIGSYHPMYDALFPLLKLNNQKGKKSAVFGTYGWASVAVGKLKAKLSELEYDVVDEVDLRFGPQDDEQYGRLRQLGKTVVGSVRGD